MLRQRKVWLAQCNTWAYPLARHLLPTLLVRIRLGAGIRQTR